MTPRTTPRIAVLRPIGTTAVWLFVSFCLFAFLFMLVSSVKSSSEILNTPWSLPAAPDIGNWSRAWVDSGFGAAAVNTLVLVVTA